MKKLIYISLALLALTANAQSQFESDKHERDDIAYVLQCGNELFSSARYQWLKHGIAVPSLSDFGSYEALNEFLIKKIQDSKIEVNNTGDIIRFGNLTYERKFNNKQLTEAIREGQKLLVNDITWSENERYINEHLGLPEQIDGCKVHVLWMEDKRNSSEWTKKRIGNAALMEALEQQNKFDVILLSLPAALRRMKTPQLALLLADNKFKMSKQTLKRIFDNTPNKEVSYFGVTGSACSVVDNNDAAFQCVQTEFFSKENSPFRIAKIKDTSSYISFNYISLPSRYTTWRRNFQRESATSDVYNKSGVMFGHNGRVISFTVGTLYSAMIQDSNAINEDKVFLVRNPFYMDQSYRGNVTWVKVRVTSDLTRRIFIEADGSVKVEKDAQDIMEENEKAHRDRIAAEEAQKRRQEQDKYMKEENEKYERTRKRCVMPDGSRCKQ